MFLSLSFIHPIDFNFLCIVLVPVVPQGGGPPCQGLCLVTVLPCESSVLAAMLSGVAHSLALGVGVLLTWMAP